MRISLTVFCTVLCCLTRGNLFGQAGFTAPATVVVNAPVTVTNTSAGATTYFWNFCSGSMYNQPQVTNLGNPGAQLNVPVFLATAKDGNDHYAFVTNHTGNLLKYSFGSSLLSTPVIQDLGDVGGAIPVLTEGVQVVKDANGWHVLAVGGATSPAPTIGKVDFGPSLSNPNPTGVNWGNIGNMDTPSDLCVVQENNKWYGFTVNFTNNTITRFDFGTSFNSTPTGINLGNIGNMWNPTGVFAIQDNGNWYIFVANEKGTLSRLDFGNSLLNTPTGVNLGNVGGFLVRPRDISVIHDCGKTFGLVMDAGRGEVVRIDFNGGITGPLTATSVGISGFKFLHSISAVFRENNNLYAFLLDAWDHTLHRLVYNSCANASIPSSTLQQPPVFSYNTPGTYTINLITDEGLPTQSAFCKNIVVKPVPVVPSVASFTAPDTVCVNTPVTINNTTTGGSTFFWNFCSGSLYNQPQFTNLGNPGSQLNVPVFLATAKDGNDYYAFVANHNGSLLKYSFGSSLLNTPAVQHLGSVGGVVPDLTEGVQIVQDATGWHVLLVGGPTNPVPTIGRIDFGPSLSNPSPTGVNWGNIGNMDIPHDLYVIQENNNWYGFTVNAGNNSITRFDFGTSFSNTPVGVNLGNIGNMSSPTGVFVIADNGNWYIFVTNATGTLSRLDFGSSLSNAPTGINLGDLGGFLEMPRDLSVIHDCGKIFGLVMDAGRGEVVRVDFNGGITGVLSPTSVGTGGFRFLHSISTVFRENNNLYAFMLDAYDNSLHRLVYNSCTNASIPSSLLQQPPTFTYNTPGTYTINLVADEALPTQSIFCKTVVVLPLPVVDLGADKTVCDGVSVELDAGPGFSSYKWNNNAATQKITVTQSGTYSVEVSNGGCTAQDAVQVNMNQVMQLNPVITDIDCNQPGGKITVNTTGGVLPYHYYLDGADQAANNIFDNLPAGDFTVKVQDQLGCELSQILNVKVDENRIITTSANVLPPSCNGLQNGTIDVQVQKGIPPFEFAIKGQPYQNGNTFNNLAGGTYTVYTRNGVCLDSLLLTLNEPSPLELQYTKEDELCGRSNGKVAVTVAGGTPPYDLYWNSVATPVQTLDDLSAGSYNLEIMDAHGCDTATVIAINNITPPPVNILNHDITINIGETVQLVAVNAPDYLWTPAEGLSCVNCAAPLARPLQPTSYIVTTLTGKNCVPADTVNIRLSYHLSLFVPNAFTPNGDGQNDLFRVKAKGIAMYHLQVFNRWGQLLFETADATKGWNGLFKNVLQPYGAYVYVVQYAYFGKNAQVLQQKGTFTLMR